MPSGSVQSRTKPVPIIYRRALSTVSSSQPVVELRRSCRSRRPSLHQLESDEYKANSQASSRPSSPSRPVSKDQSEQNPQGKRGARPGRIVQPDDDAWAARHSSSPEPLANAGSPPSDSDMADERAASDKEMEIEIVSKAEAIRRVSAYLGYDATRMPNSIIKAVYAEIPNGTQANPSSPVEVKGGTAPALLQSADRMVLGRGSQPSTGGTPIAAPQEPEAQLAYPDVQLPNNDSATESESEPEIIELGPGDSVSQRVPPALPPFPVVPLSSQPVPTLVHYASHRAGSNAKRLNSDTATADESDDANIETTRHNSKRQRLVALPSRVPTPHSILSSGSLNPPLMSDVDAVLAWATRLATQAASSHTVADQGAGPSRPNQANDPYRLLASVLDNLRSHLPAPAPAPTPAPAPAPAPAPKPRASTVRRLRRPRNSDFIEDDAEILEAEAALALGKRIRPRHKPCLADFPGFRRHIASSAIPDLNATLVTQGMYEVYGTVMHWAEESYNRTWDVELPHEPLESAPVPLKAIMAHRASYFRGETVARIRPEVPHLWPFIGTPRTPDDLQYNIRLARRLLPNQFHCRDPKTGADPYEHPALQACIDTGLFWGPESVGVVFQDRFQPLPLPAVAFILTAMQHCIEEWLTGRFVKIELNVDEQRKEYQSHIPGLLEYDRKAPTRLGEFRAGWFRHGLEHAGASTELEVPHQSITRADQIRADSPAHSVEPTARAAKGKGRVAY